MPLKQELKSAVKVSRKTFFNPKAWFGYNLFSSQVQVTLNYARDLLEIPAARRQETFDQAIKRLKLTEQNLKDIWLRYLLLALFFVVSAAGLLGYAFYLVLHHGSLAGCVLSMAAAGLGLANAFRYHFMAFQIRHRKLGCTFDEWLKGKTTEKGGSRP